MLDEHIFIIIYTYLILIIVQRFDLKYVAKVACVNHRCLSNQCGGEFEMLLTFVSSRNTASI